MSCTYYALHHNSLRDSGSTHRKIRSVHEVSAQDKVEAFPSLATAQSHDGEAPPKPQTPPPVVVDGLNVARNRGFTSQAAGDAFALALAIEHFLCAGRAVYAIVPTWSLDGGKERRASARLAHAEVLKPYLHKQLLLSPSGVDCDDFILRVALEQGADILSNDLYRDHVTRGVVNAAWLRAHRRSFMFCHGTLLVHGEPPRAATAASHGTTLAVSGMPTEAKPFLSHMAAKSALNIPPEPAPQHSPLTMLPSLRAPGGTKRRRADSAEALLITARAGRHVHGHVQTCCPEEIERKITKRPGLGRQQRRGSRRGGSGPTMAELIARIKAKKASRAPSLTPFDPSSQPLRNRRIKPIPLGMKRVN